MPETRDQEERTESATPRRREEARKRGQVARSMELTSAFMFLVGMVTIRLVFPSIFSQMMNISIQCWMFDSRSSLAQNLVSSIKHSALALAPLAMVMLASSLVVNYAQVGFLVSGEALTPKFERINPVKGISRLISKRTVVMLIQSLFKVLVVGYILYITLKGERDKIISLSDMPIKMAVAQVSSIIFKMGMWTALLLFVLAAFDYAYQRWDYERSLRMTKQEFKEEMKHTEGDPLIKARIRSIQREVAARRMMQEVPKADVIITNPTALAVALKYDKEVDSAPKICAKGARLIAERIKAIAREHDVPITEDKPLARALFNLELGREIPVVLYKAVAEILARVYRLETRD
jgi:flagellar biosynthetic protein FlhB